MGRLSNKEKQVDIITRFWNKVDILDPDSCWMWKGSKDAAGYGKFYDGLRQCMAHRFAYEITIGPLGKLFALHKCDTPSCCNPNHLFKGTAWDNSQDASAKGRLARNPVISIESLQRIETIARLYESGISQVELARMYGCTKQNISRICKEHKYRLYNIKV